MQGAGRLSACVLHEAVWHGWIGTQRLCASVPQKHQGAGLCDTGVLNLRCAQGTGVLCLRCGAL